MNTIIPTNISGGHTFRRLTALQKHPHSQTYKLSVRYNLHMQSNTNQLMHTPLKVGFLSLSLTDYCVSHVLHQYCFPSFVSHDIRPLMETVAIAIQYSQL